MSPDLKDVLTATIPSILPAAMVGFGILINKNDFNRVSGEITSLCFAMGAMQSQFHADIMMLVNISNEMDKRVSRLEDKSKDI